MDSGNTRAAILRILAILPIAVYLPLNAVLWHFGFIDPFLLDFGAYYQAALRFLQGQPLYELSSVVTGDFPSFGIEMPFLYPPITVLLFIPFTVLRPLTAFVAWSLFTGTALVVSVWLLTGSYGNVWSTKERVLICLLTISFGPLLTSFKHGQVNGLLTAFMCLAIVAMRGNSDLRAFLAGAVTMFAGFLKPVFLAFGAQLVLDRRRMVGATTALILFVVLNLLFGVDAVGAYLEVLQGGKGWSDGRTPPSQWNASRFQPLDWLGPAMFVVIGMLVVGTAAVSLYARREGSIPEPYITALGAAMIPLVHPAVYVITLNALIPAYIILASEERMSGGRVPLALFASLLLVHIHPYTVEFLAKIGPELFPVLEALVPVLPFLQPASYGVAILVVFISLKIIESAKDGL